MYLTYMQDVKNKADEPALKIFFTLVVQNVLVFKFPPEDVNRAGMTNLVF